MNPDIIGKSVPIVTGVVIGLIGTFCIVKKAAGRRERDFMFRSAVVGWLFIAACLAGMELLGKAYSA